MTNPMEKDNSGSPINNETPGIKDPDNSQRQDESPNDSDQDNWEKRYKDSSREATKFRESNEINIAYREVLKNPKAALDLNPKIADKVIKELYDDGFSTVDNWEELKKVLLEEDPKKPVSEEELTKKVRNQIKEEEEIEKATNIKEELLSKLNDDMRKKVEEEFEEVLGNRKLTTSFVEREIKKIITFYRKEDGKNDDAFAKAATNKIGSGKPGKGGGMTIDKLKALRIPEKDWKTLYPELFNN